VICANRFRKCTEGKSCLESSQITKCMSLMKYKPFVKVVDHCVKEMTSPIDSAVKTLHMLTQGNLNMKLSLANTARSDKTKVFESSIVRRVFGG